MSPENDDSADPRGDLGVALIGHGFMGAAHSQAWRTAPAFFDLPLRPRTAVLVGRDVEATRSAAPARRTPCVRSSPATAC